MCRSGSDLVRSDAVSQHRRLAVAVLAANVLGGVAWVVALVSRHPIALWFTGTDERMLGVYDWLDPTLYLALPLWALVAVGTRHRSARIALALTALGTGVAALGAWAPAWPFDPGQPLRLALLATPSPVVAGLVWRWMRGEDGRSTDDRP